MSLEQKPRSLSKIACEIRLNWKHIYFGAEPWLRAMAQLEKITDNYYLENGDSVVLYFLSNAGTWRGPVARRIKIELDTMVKTLRV